MKTKLKILGMAAIAATACLVGNSNSPTTEQTALTLANVEALTRTEITFELDKNCVKDSEDYCVPDYYIGAIHGRPV